jgi:hypothetical protein
MSMPDISPQQISWAVDQVASYIELQRKKYRLQAAPLSSLQRVTMQPFFPVSVLDGTRLLTFTNHRLPNPDFYSTLAAMGIESKYLPDFSAGMAAVTFQDVIISYEPFTDQLLFHELVHAVQYQKLGVDEFAERYVNGFLQGGGYDGIPLEINAYQLDDRFAKNPGREFSVEMEVQKWVDTGKF